MEIVCALLFVSVVINVALFFNLSFKNQAIKDLERRHYVKDRDFVQMLLRLKEYQRFEPAGRDSCTRRCINEGIEKYASRRIKRELNIDFDRKNV